MKECTHANATLFHIRDLSLCVFWYLSDPRVRTDGWEKRTEFRQRPEGKVLLQPQGNGMGSRDSPCELQTHLCPGDRGPHSRAA